MLTPSNNRIRKVDTNGIITTVAGNGTQAYGRWRRGHQRQPELSLQAWPLMPPATCLLLTTSNNRIRKVDTNGIITTVAGNGSYGYSGDGGAATNASLDDPYGVALMPPATCLLLTAATIASAKWTPTASSPPWRAGGNCVGTMSGDGGAATNASLYHPVRRGLRCLRQPVYC